MGTGQGYNYPSNGCSVSGQNVWYNTPNGPLGTQNNDICLTAAQIESYVSTMVTQTGLLARTQPGHTPIVDVLTPAGVETCLDAAGKVCSEYSSAPATFCSYHGQVNVNGTEIPYVVQPWTATWDKGKLCDDANVPTIPNPVPVDQLATDVGHRLVSPLSQGNLGAIINPNLTGWFGLDGSEIYDNGCTPLGGRLDAVTLNGRSVLAAARVQQCRRDRDRPQRTPMHRLDRTRAHVRRPQCGQRRGCPSARRLDLRFLAAGPAG